VLRPQPESSSRTRPCSGSRTPPSASNLSDGAVAQLRALYESRIHRLEPQAEGDGHHGDESDKAWRLRRLHRELIGAERDRLRDLRREGEISSDSQRRIQRDLDLEEARLAAGQ
jgi:monovalent cation/hydrogen antiporter